MYFSWFVSDWLSQVPANLLGGILKGIKTAFFALDAIVYKLIINLYEMFMSLCTGRLLDGDILEELAGRIGLVLGIVMLFLVIISFIQMMLNPDIMTDSEKGAVSVIKRTLFVIIALGVSNFVFDTLYEVQTIVVKSNVISRILLPFSIETSFNENEGSGENEDDGVSSIMSDRKFGALLSEELLMSFYTIEDFDGMAMSSEDDEKYKYCVDNVNAFRTQIVYYNRFDLGYKCLNEEVMVGYQIDDETVSEPQEISIVDFNWLLSALCGIAVVYLLFMYCLQVGIRMVQLLFLEIISPMAIVSYLTPKKSTMFNEWSKIYFSTYIDVFIRIAIINFVFFLIATIFATEAVDGLSFFNSIQGADVYTRSFYVVVIVLALLFFAKKAPDLLKKLFPSSSANLGIKGFKDMVGGSLLQKGLKTGAKVATAGAAIGLIGGTTSAVSRFRANWKHGGENRLGRSLVGAAGGLIGGSIGGLVAGGRKGGVFSNISKGISASKAANDKYDDLIMEGGSIPGKIGSSISSYFGPTRGQSYARQIQNLDKMAEFKKNMYAAADEMVDVKSAKDTWEQMTQWKGESDSDYETRKTAAYERYKDLRNAAAEAAIDGRNSYEVGDESHAMNDDDLMYAADVRAAVQHAEEYRSSHSVQRWDDSSKTYVNLAPITTRKDLADASNYAHATKTHIVSSPDYSSSQANDKAAGVNSNRK